MRCVLFSLMLFLSCAALGAAVLDLGDEGPDVLIGGPYPAGDAGSQRLPRAMVTGDFNGDGVVEVAVATGGGEVIVVAGPDLSSSHLKEGSADILLRVIGGTSFPGFGSSLAAGDFNGDGITDLLVGAPEAGRLDGDHLDRGAVVLLEGQPFRRKKIDLDKGWAPGLVIRGLQPGGRLGHAVTMADFDGDTRCDAAFSAPLMEEGKGRVFFLRGGKIPRAFHDLDTAGLDGMILPAKGGRLTGWTLAAGDFDGDGRHEIAVTGRRGGSGFLALVGAGTPGIRILDPDASWFGTGPGDLATVVGADLDGDGRDEVVAGLDGRIWLAAGLEPGFGPVELQEVAVGGVRSSLGSRFGVDLSAGDVDGDGREEVLAGVPGFDPDDSREDAGTAAIYDLAGMLLMGKASETFRRAVLGDSAGDALGSRVLLADLDGDGRDEILAGSPGRLVRYEHGYPRQRPQGRVDVVPGTGGGVFDLSQAAAPGSLAGATTGTGTFWPGSEAGLSVARGDFDGDGLDELALAGGQDARAWVLPSGGARDGDLATAPLEQGFLLEDRLIRGVKAGDLNGDGRDDLLVMVDPRTDSPGGEVLAFFAGRRGFSGYLSDPDIVFAGNPGDSLGMAMRTGPAPDASWPTAAVGDLDGDTVPDLALGMPASRRFGWEPGSSAGGVWVLYGPLTAAGGGVLGEPTGAQLLLLHRDLAGLGSSVDLGDRNGDGIDDLLAGTMDGDRLYVLDGGSRVTGTWILDETVADLTVEGVGGFGSSALFADTDGDGVQEIVVSAPTSSGVDGLRAGAGMVVLYQDAHDRMGLFQVTDPALGPLAFVGGAPGWFTGTLLDSGNMDGDAGEEILALLPGTAGGYGEIAVLDPFPTTGIIDLGLRPPAHRVRGSADLPLAWGPFAAADTDADGRAEIVIGFPDFATPAPPRPSAGATAVADPAADPCAPLEKVRDWLAAVAGDALTLRPDEVLQDGPDRRLMLAQQTLLAIDHISSAIFAGDPAHKVLLLEQAFAQLQGEVAVRFDGCIRLAEPDRLPEVEDWVLSCDAQRPMQIRADASGKALTCHINGAIGLGMGRPFDPDPLWEGGIRRVPAR